MATTTVKRNDTHDVSWTVSADLTGAQNVRMILSSVGDINCTVTDAPGGIVTHTLTGNLAAGKYQLEVEVTDVLGVIRTYPRKGKETLVVEADLG